MNLALLLVEDDVVDRAAVRRALKAAAIGGTIREVDTVDAALEMLQSSTFDCVLLDYQLPKGDGLELLARARALGLRTPIVALTGHGDEQLAA